MKKEELVLVVGGSSLSGTVLNAVIRAVNVAFEIGRALGSAIRRIKSGQRCSVK
jgi:hypothetical protein